MEAARDVLLDGGLVGFSMRKVASRCGVSATAIYRHFEDKDALLASVVDEAFAIFAGYLMRGLKAPDPLSRFRGMAEAYFDFATEQARYYQLIFMTNCDDLGLDRVDEASHARRGGTFQMLIDRIEECQRAGIFQPGDSQVQAVFAWSTLHGLAALRSTGNLGIADATFATLRSAQIEGVATALKTGCFWVAPALAG